MAPTRLLRISKQQTVPLFIEGRAHRAEGVPNEVRSKNTTRSACNAPVASRLPLC